MAQFAPASALSTEPDGPALHAVDVDGDTDLDLFGLFDLMHFRWYANTDGNGDFSALLNVVSATEPISRWTTGDLNGDALPDIVFLDAAGTTVWWFQNIGGAQYDPPVAIGTLPSTPGAMHLADITGEGFPDIVVTLEFDVTGGGIAWFPNSGVGFGPLQLAELGIAGSTSALLVSGDMDLTGGIDLVVNNWNQVVFALRNIAGDASAWQVDTLISGPLYAFENASTLIDVDGDGDLDIAEAGAIALHWAENHIGEGGSWSAFTDHELEPWDSAGNGAFGHLGCNGAAAAVYVPSFPILPVRWSAWVNDLDALAYRAELIGVPRGSDLLLADLNGDGNDDLVLNHPDGVAWYRNILQPATTPLVLPALDTLCMYAPPFPLPAAEPVGGHWNGFAVSEDIFYRSNVNGTGSYSLTHAVYEPGGCPIGGLTSIYVTEQPVISPALSTPLCTGDGPIQMSSTPAATVWIGIGPDAILDPEVFSNGVIVALYTDATGETCSTESNPIETWTSLPASILPTGPFCYTAGPQQIVASEQPPFGVEWSGDIVSWNSSGATFDPSMGAGTYVVVLHAEPTGPFQCPGTDTLVIVVSDLLPTVITSPVPPLCSTGSALDLLPLGQPVGGLWSGPGVTNGEFAPAQLGSGSHYLTYTYFDPGGCAASEALMVEVADEIEINWSVEDLIFCEGDGPVALEAFPSNGQWSQPVDASGVFDPSALQPGAYTFYYTWQGVNDCQAIVEPLAVERWATSSVTIDPVGVLCDDDPAIVITGSPAGVWSDTGTGTGAYTVIEPTLLGTGTWPVTLTAANPGECAASATLVVLIEVCTGTEETVSTGLTANPNPFTDQLVVDLGNTPMSTVELMDATGRLVLQEDNPGTRRLALDLSGTPPGTYLLRVRDASGTVHSLRLVKL